MLVAVVFVDHDRLPTQNSLSRGALTRAQRLIVQRLPRIVAEDGVELAGRFVPQVQRDGVAMQQLARLFGDELHQLGRIEAAACRRRELIQRAQRACLPLPEVGSIAIHGDRSVQRPRAAAAAAL